MYRFLKATVFSLTIMVTFFVNHGFAQDKKKPLSVKEHQRKSMHSRDSLMRTLNKIDTSINARLQKVQQYVTTFNQINNNLATGLDTADISSELPRVISRLDKINQLANTHKSSTMRYLAVLRDNLDRLQGKLEGWQADLEDISTKLVQNQTELVRFSKDSILKIIPADTLLRSTFLIQRNEVKNLWHRTDSVNSNNLLKVSLLQDKVTIAYTNLLDATDQIDAKIARFAKRAVAGETGYIWEVDPQYNNFKSALKSTVNLNDTQTKYFLKTETIIHLAGLLFLVIILSWILFNRSKAISDNKHPEIILDQANYITKYPILSSLIVAFAIVPYFYNHPPVLFLEVLFLISLLLILSLVKRTFSKAAYHFLLQLFGLTVIYCVSNIFIEISNADRFVIFALSALSILSAYQYLKKTRLNPDEQLPRTRFILKIFILLHLLSLLLNITGRFSLAKIIGVTAAFNLWFLISLFFVVQIIIQALYLQFKSKKDDSSILSWLDYDILQKKFRNILSVIASLLWVFFLLQNLNIEDWGRDFLSDMLSQSRSVGGASFTFGGFVVFISIIWLSSVISKIVSYFYDVSAKRVTDLSVLKKKNFTSTLLIRIGVFSVGFLLAVAASNFPLEKLTIIISAFGIGIGFGLQNIVNNLVSGLILAFEKPIQIGDTIEVDNRSGVMKEIGIRSCKILTADGSEVIIPNGDLISHHVVNWTLSNSNRRIELIIGTAYGTDIEKVNGLLRDMLNNRDDIMTTPGPSVFLHNLNQSTVDFRIFFWASDLNNTLELKSRILKDIYETFKREGIEIPFPQRDVHVHFPDGEPMLKMVKPEDVNNEEEIKNDEPAKNEKPGKPDKITNKNPPGQAP